MIVFLNGNFVPEEQAMVSVFDRSFCLGDGLFEALPVYSGKFFLWEQHWQRLQSGAAFLKIRMPYSPEFLRSAANELLGKNSANDCVLRMQLSRGIGARGYSIKLANSPTFVMSVHPRAPVTTAARIVTSSVRIAANDPLARFKSCGKTAHVLARMEADAVEADEALLLNTDGNIAEATSANLFWLEGETVCTPPLSSGALPGVTRDVILELCRKLQIPSAEKNITPERLLKVDGAFLTSIAVEIRPICEINGRNVPALPIISKLQDAFASYVETANQRA